MGEPVKIVVPGDPVSWKRAGRNTKFGVAFYTPPKARRYGQRIKGKAALAMMTRKIMTGPVSMRIMVSLPIAKSWPKWKRLAAAKNELLPTSKPDIDNYEKIAMDALNEIVYVDDSQVTDMIATKRYAAEPSLIITVAEIAAAT